MEPDTVAAVFARWTAHHEAVLASLGLPPRGTASICTDSVSQPEQELDGTNNATDEASPVENDRTNDQSDEQGSCSCPPLLGTSHHDSNITSPHTEDHTCDAHGEGNGDSYPILQQESTSNGSTSSTSTTAGHLDGLPYHLSDDIISILRNGPFSHSRLQKRPSEMSDQQMMPPAKKVVFKTPLEEEVVTSKYTMRHSDIESSTTKAPTGQLPAADLLVQEQITGSISPPVSGTFNSDPTARDSLNSCQTHEDQGDHSRGSEQSSMPTNPPTITSHTSEGFNTTDDTETDSMADDTVTEQPFPHAIALRPDAQGLSYRLSHPGNVTQPLLDAIDQQADSWKKDARKHKLPNWLQAIQQTKSRCADKRITNSGQSWWTLKHSRLLACRTCVSMSRLCFVQHDGMMHLLPLPDVVSTTDNPSELAYYVRQDEVGIDSNGDSLWELWDKKPAAIAKPVRDVMGEIDADGQRIMLQALDV